MRALIHPTFDRVGFSGPADTPHLDIFLRARVVAWACKLGMEECTEEAADNFRRWMAQHHPDAEGANP